MDNDRPDLGYELNQLRDEMARLRREVENLKRKTAQKNSLITSATEKLQRVLLRGLSNTCLDSISSLARGTSLAQQVEDLPSLSLIRSSEGTPIESLPTVAISIVTYNSAMDLAAFLQCLLDLDYDRSKVSLYFRDNGSKDDTVALLQSFITLAEPHFASLTFLADNNNVGFGAGHNSLLSTAAADFYLISNVDVTFSKGTLLELIRVALNDDEKVACWEPAQRTREHPKYYDPATLKTSWASHFFILIRGSVFREINGYDENIFLYGEDVEFSFRVNACGKIIRYVPWIAVNHLSASVENLPATSNQVSGAIFSAIYLRAKFQGAVAYLLAAVSLTLSIAFILRSHPKSYAGPILKGLGNGIWQGAKAITSFRARLRSSSNCFSGLDYSLHRQIQSRPEVPELQNLSLVTVVIRTIPERLPEALRAIASALNQDYPYIEVLVIQDGLEADQGSKDFLAEGHAFSRSLKWFSQERAGRSAAGNAGINLAEGDLLCFLDDDDQLFADHISTLINKMTESGSSAAFSGSWEVQTEYLVRSRERLKFIDHRHSAHPWHSSLVKQCDLDRVNRFPIQTVLFEKRLCKLSGGFDVSMSALEDWDFWYRLAEHTDFVGIPSVTSLYRTPYGKAQRARRHAGLDKAFENAVEKRKLADRNETKLQMTKRLFLHIGTEKTGSSYLQQKFAELNEKSAKPSILFPKTGRRSSHHVDIVHAFLNLGSNNSEGAPSEILSALEQEIASSTEDVILSSEHFHMNENKLNLGALLKFFIELNVSPTAVVTFRDPISYAHSLYAEAIKWGEDRPFQEWLQFQSDRGRFLYSKTVQLWRDAGFTLLALNYDACKDNLAESFLRVCRLPEPSQINNRQVNVSPDYNFLCWIREQYQAISSEHRRAFYLQQLESVTIGENTEKAKAGTVRQSQYFGNIPGEIVTKMQEEASKLNTLLGSQQFQNWDLSTNRANPEEALVAKASKWA